MNVLLIVYDNESYVHHFPLGIGYIAATLRQHGYAVTIYNQDVHHYPEEHLTQYLDSNKFDVVGIGLIAGYYQYRKLLKISEAINKSKNRPAQYILGGHGPSPEPVYFLQKTGADIAVMGEGDVTIVEVMRALSNKSSLAGIQGIAYRDGSKFVVNGARPLVEDIDTLPWPAYDLFPIHYYRMLRLPHCTRTDFTMPILSARGCTFTCNFCYRMDKGYRARKPDAIIEEINYLQTDYNINYIDFTDDLLMSSKSRTVEVCEAIMKLKKKIKWFCNGRLNYATPDILKLMKVAGCVFINYGIESFDDVALKTMNKALTTNQIVKGIEATLDVGISPGYNIIFGNIGENAKTLQQGVDFLLKYDDGAQLRTIRPVTPYPGSPLYYYAIENGFLEGVEDFYENKHVNSDLLAVNFTNLSEDEFYKILTDANLALLDNYYKKQLDNIKAATRNLYATKDATFRGYRRT